MVLTLTIDLKREKRGVGLYWEEYQKVGHNPITKEDNLKTRKRIKINSDLPIKDEYSQFIRNLLLSSE